MPRERPFSIFTALIGTIALGACAAPVIPRLPPPDPSLPDAEIEARIAFIEERLEGSRRHAHLWNLGWWIANGVGVATGTAEVAAADDGSERAAGVVTVVLSLGGFAYQHFLPMRARFGADPIRDLPDRTHEEKVARLEKAQELLEYDAERATAQLDWKAHVGNAAVAAAATGIVLASGDRKSPAFLTGAQVLLGGEAQFWTEPAAPRRNIEDYVRRFRIGPSRVSHRWQVVPQGAGLALRLDF